MASLSEEEKQTLQKEIGSVDFSLIERANEKKIKDFQVTPIEIFTADRVDLEREALEELGLSVIRENKVGAVLLCGGQGTRLGSPHSKGMFDMGITRPLYIFDLHFSYLCKVAKRAGHFFPIFVMTSIYNDAEIREFFELQNYFHVECLFLS